MWVMCSIHVCTYIYTHWMADGGCGPCVCVCVCVRMGVRVCTCLHVHVRVCVCVCVIVCMHAHVREVCLCVCACVVKAHIKTCGLHRYKPTCHSHSRTTSHPFLQNILEYFGGLGVALLLLWLWLLSVLLMVWLLCAHCQEPLAELPQTLGLNRCEVANQKFAHTGYTNTWKREEKSLYGIVRY